MGSTSCSSSITCILDSNNNDSTSSLNNDAAMCPVLSIIYISILHMFILKFIFLELVLIGIIPKVYLPIHSVYLLGIRSESKDLHLYTLTLQWKGGPFIIPHTQERIQFPFSTMLILQFIEWLAKTNFFLSSYIFQTHFI